MAEGTIGDLVQIQSGYTSYVNLKQDLFDDSRNIGRMSRYRPIASHRKAFQELARSLNVNDGRCYLLTGSYGTGKSHLCLMFANYLQTPSGEKPMPDFFKHYADQDRHAAEDLKLKRCSGRYLVALCEWGGKEDFDEIVLRAVDEALSREGFGDDFDTHYLQALKRIEEWQAYANGAEGVRSRFYEELERELSDQSPALTVSAFKKGLKGFDHQALAEFRRIHVKLTSSPFTHDKADLVAILTHALKSKKFKERFQGILVLFDEFGDTMERGNLNPTAFMRLAELCAQTPQGCARLAFVSTAHRGLTDYARPYQAVDFRKVSDRVKEVPLTADGVEEIIGAIVVPKKKERLWQETVEPRSDEFDALLNDCVRLKLFGWLSAPKIRTAIIEDIFPMHPMATYALLRLARDVASNNRSVFTFFSSDIEDAAPPGSYGHFAALAPIVTNNKLNLYTADRLCEFFADTLKSDNKELRDTVRDIIKDYENSLRTLNLIADSSETAFIQFKEDALIMRLLRLMLVYEIIGIQNRADNLQFGLYLTTDAERNELRNRVKALVEKGILYFVKETGIYQFKKSQSVDLDGKMETYIQDSVNQPQNLVAELEALVPLEKQEIHLEAKDYNLPYSEDKRLLRRIVRAVDLGFEKEEGGEKLNFFKMLEREVESETGQSGDYEGVALYVLCENTEDINRAKSFCARNESDRIVVAIPKEPIHFLDAVLELRALVAIETSDERKTFSMQDNAALQARLNGDQHGPGARGKLKALRDKLLNAREITWYGKFAQVMPTEAARPYDAANRVMEALYTKRNLFAHDDFSKLHIKVDKSRNVALKEAVEELADYTEAIVVDTEYAQQRGDIRYLQKCLLHNGALRQVKVNGSKLTCEFEGSAEKFSGKLPALADMIQEIRKLPHQGKILLVDWVRRYRRPPYGQGPVALTLSLACLRRLFGDSIRFKIDETNVGDMPVRSFEEILSLSEGQYPNAFLSYRPLSTQEKGIAKLVYSTFAPPGAVSTKEYTVVEAHSALQTWWDQLPPLTKVGDIYRDCEILQIVPFIQAMQKVAARDAHSFLFDELLTAFGLEAGMAISRESVETLKAGLPKVKDELTFALEGVERRILESVRQLFGVEANTNDDIFEGIKGWYNKLDSNQRDSHAPWHNHDSRPLVLCLKSITDLRETFMNRIPDSTDYNMRPVRDWMQDRVDEYVQRLRRGKEHIENNRTRVGPAQVIPKGEYEWSPEGSLMFRDSVSLTFKPPVKGAKVFVAEGTADPTDSGSQRTLYESAEPLKVSEHKTLKVAVQDAGGNWSPVQTVNLINANKEYEPAISGNLLGEKTATFKFPVDRNSLKVTCREIFRKSLEFGVIAADDLKDCIEEALKELKLKK